MCFAPQWCALFPHRNFQSEMCFAPQRRAFFSTSQLPKVLRTRQMFTLLTSKCLRATTACTFSTSQLPKVFRIWCALTILASHHNNVHFFHITTSKSDPNPTVFHIISPDGSTPAALVSLLFDPPEPQHIGKHSAWQIFYLFEHLDLLSSSLTLPTSALPSVHIFGSSTSKMSFDTRMV